MNIHIRNLNTFTNQHQKRKWLYESLLRKSESSRPLALTRTTSSVPCGIFLLLLLLLLCSFFSSYKRISEKVKIQIPIERCEAFVWLVGFLRKKSNLSFSFPDLAVVKQCASCFFPSIFLYIRVINNSFCCWKYKSGSNLKIYSKT